MTASRYFPPLCDMAVVKDVTAPVLPDLVAPRTRAVGTAKVRAKAPKVPISTRWSPDLSAYGFSRTSRA